MVRTSAAAGWSASARPYRRSASAAPPVCSAAWASALRRSGFSASSTARRRGARAFCGLPHLEPGHAQHELGLPRLGAFLQGRLQDRDALAEGRRAAALARPDHVGDAGRLGVARVPVEVRHQLAPPADARHPVAPGRPESCGSVNEACGASSAVTLGMWHEKQLAPARCWRLVSGVGMDAWSAAGSWQVLAGCVKVLGPLLSEPLVGGRGTSCTSWPRTLGSTRWPSSGRRARSR